MTGTCPCGAVSVTLPTPPEFIHDCNCSLCKRSGAAWGYFPSIAPTVDGDTLSYQRADRETPVVEMHACPVCSTTTHFTLTRTFKDRNPSADQMGVNMRLFNTEHLVGVELRYPDGKNWAGEGPFTYRKAAIRITENSPW